MWRKLCVSRRGSQSSWTPRPGACNFSTQTLVTTESAVSVTRYSVSTLLVYTERQCRCNSASFHLCAELQNSVHAFFVSAAVKHFRRTGKRGFPRCNGTKVLRNFYSCFQFQVIIFPRIYSPVPSLLYLVKTPSERRSYKSRC